MIMTYARSKASCMKYPLIIGTDSGDNWISQFDLSSDKDMLAVVGYTNDSSLVVGQTPNQGFLIMYENLASLDGAANIKWAKAYDDQGQRWSFISVAFSEDSSQVVAHSIDYLGGGAYHAGDAVFVFSSTDGSIITVQGYDDSQAASSPITRGFAITNGPSNDLYMLVKWCPFDQLCPFVLLRTPVMITSTYWSPMPWAIRSNFNSIALGLRLMNVEPGVKLILILAYEKDVYITIKMFDTADSPSPAPLDSVVYSHNEPPTSYALHTESTTIIFANFFVNQGLKICRIMWNQATKRFATNKGWFVSGLSASIQVRAIFYDNADSNKIELLIQDQYTLYYCVANLAAGQFTLDKQLPRNINYATLGLFISSNNYLVGLNIESILDGSIDDLTTHTTYNWKTGVIFSNQKSNTCIQVKSDNIVSTLALTNANGINTAAHMTASISKYAYFYTNRWGFKDLQVSNLLKYPNCANYIGAMSVNRSCSKEFVANLGQETLLTVDAFLTCGVPDSFSYSYTCLANCGVISPANLFVSPAEPVFTVVATLPKNVYAIRLTGTTSVTLTFDFNLVFNSPPHYSTESHFLYGVPIGGTTQLNMNPVYDDEGDTFTVVLALDTITVPIATPSKICVGHDEAVAQNLLYYDAAINKFKDNANTLPQDFKWSCIFLYRIVLTDQRGAISTLNTIQLEIAEINMPPVWVGGSPSATVTLRVGEILDYPLPAFKDPNEADTLSSFITSVLPTCITQTSQFEFQIHPSSGSDIGQYLLTGEIRDNRAPPLALAFSITIDIVNGPPEFLTYLINPAQNASLFGQYILPEIFDRESPFTDPITIVAKEYGKETLPEFMFLTFDPPILQLMGVETDVGTYALEITLSDSLYAETAYNFSVTVFPVPPASAYMRVLLQQLLNLGPPVFIQDLPIQQVINKGTIFNFNLPPIYDPDNDMYDCYVELGSAKPFATLNGQSIKFKPLAQHVAITPYLIQITLRDFNVNIQKKTMYTLRVIVNGTKNSEAQNNYFIIDDNDDQDGKNSNGASNQKKIKTKIRLVEVTQNHRAKIKLTAKNQEKIMAKLNNDSFTINVTTRDKAQIHLLLCSSQISQSHLHYQSCKITI
ncbi:hypothetical protein FGO68_gene4765 [Halteria grandinella]|uniref:Uncharacterized protein n=1 Tax=Halteria grandinella TaxID=5974 RepID=A0A8J8P500_HALGN|nr:hypothetical protein FGO68_gene4765 [Halteria grandinella]